jgi:phosphotriesterase-related protein
MTSKRHTAKDIASAQVQTVVGLLRGRDVEKAMAHEHMFVDFHETSDPDYMNVIWSNKIGPAVENASILRSQGVNLVVDWTNLGIGRNAVALRDVAVQSDVQIVCATGIYKDLRPPALARISVNDLARHFIDELRFGIDGTSIRAGFVKASATEEGVTSRERPILRAAAVAAKETGSALGFHGPLAATTKAAVRILEKEEFSLQRFVWAHAQVSSLDENKALADRGAMLQYDAIGARVDEFFGGPVSDSTMLDRLEGMIDSGFEDQIMLSTDAAVCINPPSFQYDRHNTYLYRYFEGKLAERVGTRRTRKILRDNVIFAFRRPLKIADP